MLGYINGSKSGLRLNHEARVRLGFPERIMWRYSDESLDSFVLYPSPDGHKVSTDAGAFHYAPLRRMMERSGFEKGRQYRGVVHNGTLTFRPDNYIEKESKA